MSTNRHRIKELLKDLPTNPGVYQMIDQSGTIIYVGKAKNIKKRVSQYFTGQRDFKTSMMVDYIYSIEPIITKTEHDALLLENQLIKQYQPRFNVLLKDDKTYPYIKITTNEPFPKIIITRQRKNDGAKYFGPFTSYGSSRRLKQLLYDIFPIRDCKQDIDMVTLQKKCIKLDLGKCIGPCIYKDTHSDYQDLIQKCIQFLDGKSSTVIESLKLEMSLCASEKKYEKAASLRDKIKRLESIQDQQMVELETNQHYFIIGFSTNEHFHYVICQHFFNKTFMSQNGQYVAIDTPFDQFVSVFFDQLLPSISASSNIVVNESINNMIHDRVLKTNKSINMITTKKGRYHELLLLTQLNAQKSLIGLSKQAVQKQSISPLTLLKKELGLPVSPMIIFGCDISHYYGKDIVSSVVVFIDGKPEKKYYRHFNIRSIITGKSDDVKAMKETVSRLIDHYDIQPDLLLIDGGKGQLNAALSALKTKGMDHIHCIGLAKKNEEVYTPYKSTPIRLPYHHAGLNLLRYVRDEAHRFALKFQRSKRNNSIK